MLEKLRQFVTPAHVRFLLACYLAGHVLGFVILVPTGEPLDRIGRIAGGDFMQFYVAGKIVADGQADRLYDPEHFRDVQVDVTPVTFRAARYYPLYPPTVALLFAPLGALAYPVALAVWWVLLLSAYAAAGRLLLAWRNPEQPMRTADVWLGMAAFHPVIRSFWNAQLTAFWFLTLLGAHQLHQRGRGWQAGLLLSVLAMKPQLALCVGLWLVLRRDGPALIGMAVGGVLQFGVTALVFGPGIWEEYLRLSRTLYPLIGQLYDFSGDFQQSIQGILVNILGREHRTAALVVQIGSALAAGALLIRVVWIHREPTPDNLRRHYAGLVLFAVLSLPHLLIYDLVLLLIPIAYLLGREGRDRWAGGLLYGSAAIAQLYDVTGFSVVPAFSFFAMGCLAFPAACALSCRR